MGSTSLTEKLKIYRLSEDEYQMICDQLGREPQGVEWALYSALWSEHCSYKSSKVHLKKFFSKSERVLQSFGENAGVIDLGQGERIAFKMESHNHPSFIEPYQGAATGVGGILRDIFTMGARPIALANYLCFGEKDADRMSTLVDGVVRGISGYGNCVGVPTVTGQTEFHSSYNGNILVNAFALGLFRPGEEIFTSNPKEVGNLVVYVGAKTGKDGVHGASMASESFDEESESKKPTVQIGDPFFEKLLIEACLEVMNSGLVEAIQDMGAAGLTSSSFEMASKGGVGFQLNLDQVPARDESITPEEILLSESQERMLLTCRPENLEAIQKIFSKWDLDAVPIGEVTQEKKIELYWHNEKICSIDPDMLVENCPMYNRPYNEWASPHKTEDLEFYKASNVEQTLIDILENIKSTSRDWVYNQYDQRVGGRTMYDASESVAVMRLPDSGRALGIVLGCRPYMMRFDSREGSSDSVAYPSLELAAKGFEPLAVTDCLNFGNPEKPELMTEFVASVEAMSAMCEALVTPVISGNVSLYNETLDKNVTSTPSTGVVGLRETLPQVSSYFSKSGQDIVLVRSAQLKLTGQIDELKNKRPMKGSGAIDNQMTGDFVKALTQVTQNSAVSASRVVGKFGPAYALSKMCLQNTGAVIQNGDWTNGNLDESLFLENCYEVVLAVDPNFAEQLKAQLKDFEVYPLGQTGGDHLEIENYKWSLQELKSAYYSPWGKKFEHLA